MASARRFSLKVLPGSTESPPVARSGGEPRSEGFSLKATATPTELSDKQWELIEPLLPKGAWTGRPRADDRRTINGILWVLRTGARWADMPRKYGAPSTCHLRLQPEGSA